MRIAMLFHPSIHLHLDVCGGLERRALSELRTLRGKGHEAALYVGQLTGQELGVHCIPAGPQNHRLLKWHYYLRFLARARGCDILHGQYTPALALLAPRRSVIHLAGLKVSEIPLYRHFAEHTHQATFVCVAEHIRRGFLDLYPRYPEDRVRVVYTGCDTGLFAPPTARDERPPYLISFHGVWEESKGVFDLLEACSRLAQRRDDFALHMVGSATFERPTENAWRDQLRIEEHARTCAHVRLSGLLTHLDLAGHLRRVHIGVLPSKHPDPFPNAMIEMMASGLPVVAYDIGGAREALRHGETGFLVRTGDVAELARHIEVLLDSPELRRQMGTNARRYVEAHHTWDRHADQLVGIYEEIVRETGRTQGASTEAGRRDRPRADTHRETPPPRFATSHGGGRPRRCDDRKAALASDREPRSLKVGMLFHPSIRLDPQVCGGLERTALAELQHLSDRRIQARLHVSSLAGHHDHVSVLSDADWRHRLLQWPYYLRFLQATRDCSVLHGHYTPALALLSPERSVIHLHGLRVREIPLYRYFSRRSHQAHFICVARHVAEKFHEHCPALPADHLHVLYNAVNHDLFAPRRGSPAGSPVCITYHSLWEEPKGVFDVLQAVELLQRKRQDFRVHLVGSALFEGAGEAQQSTQRRAEEWARRLPTVDTVGPLTHPRLAEHLQHMDVGVFPSNHEDPFPLVPLEMMSAGLPVVAYDIGGARESVVHRETGLLVENRNVHALAQALETLLDDPQLRLRMGANARRHVERHFTWDRHVDQLLAIYEEIIRRNSRHP